MATEGGDHSSEQGTRATPRLRQPTEKGVQWQLGMKEKDWRKAVTAWRRTSDKLRHILTDDHAEIDAIKSKRDDLQSAMDTAITAQAALADAAPTDTESEARLEAIEEEHSLLMKETYGRVRSLQGSIKLSTAGSSSKHRCQQWLDQQPQLKVSDEQNNCLQADNMLNERDCGGEQAPEEDLGSSRQRQASEQRVPAPQSNQDRDKLLIDCLLDQLRLNRLPSPEPPVFDGDPLRYPAWKRAYDMLIEKKGIPPEDKFYYLLKYLKGQPLNLVQGYSLLSDDHAYTLAKRQLDKRYGNTFVLSNAFRDKLDAWPKIGSKDAEGLRKYSDFLQQCNAASKFVHHLKHLDDERENRRLLLKLPDWLTTRWGRIVVQWSRDTGAFPPFTVFVDFVVSEAEVACTLMTPSKEKRPPSNARSLSTGVQNGDGRTRETVCQFCEAQHRLEDCSSFAARSMEEKRDFIRNGNLCFGCLKPGHRSKDCRNRNTCSSCKKRHPTILHDDNWKDKRSSRRVDTQRELEEPHLSHASRNRDKPHASKTSTIVPVWLSHASTPKERLVYAMLDTQSDTTFVLRQTKEEMGITGTEVNLLLSTMTTAAEKVASERIEGFRVRALNSDKEIALPTTYTRDIMPTNRSHIPTPEVAKNLPHLEQIAPLLSPILDCEIALVIGYDCPSALTPRAVIPPPVHGGPFAMQTDLGWSIVGTTMDDRKDNDPIGLSHRAMVKVLPDELQMDGNPAEVVYSCQTRVKEEIALHQIIKPLEADFAPERAQRPYSQNDVKVFSLMEDQYRVTDDGHYETPLPFKEASKWLTGPNFLWKDENDADEEEDNDGTIPLNDPDVKQSHATTKNSEEFDLGRLNRFSTWQQARRAVANCLRFKRYLQLRCQKGRSKKEGAIVQPMSTELSALAEKEIVRHIQRAVFKDEIEILGHMEGVMARGRRRYRKTKSRLHQLDPFVDAEGILRVGGRLTRAKGPFEVKHPTILNQLQSRQKWTRTQRDMKAGDVVIIKDDQAPRNTWPLGRVVEAYKSEDNRVRKVKVAVGDRNLTASGKRMASLSYLDRPIHKLVLLLPTEDQGEFPAKEP